jgi:hypothetical protein
MSTDPRFKCSQCKQNKSSDQYGTCQKGGSHGQQGDHLKFEEALAKHASASKIDSSWRVSLDEVALTDKGIANHIASLAWKATGYRYR